MEVIGHGIAQRLHQCDCTSGEQAARQQVDDAESDAHVHNGETESLGHENCN